MGGCQKILGDPNNFLSEVKSLDIDEIPKTALSNCRLITLQLLFSKDKAEETSKAIMYLADWVINVIKYHEHNGNFEDSLEEVKLKAIGEEEKATSTTISNEKKAKAVSTSSKPPKNTLGNCYLKKGDIVELKCLKAPPAG